MIQAGTALGATTTAGQDSAVDFFVMKKKILLVLFISLCFILTVSLAACGDAFVDVDDPAASVSSVKSAAPSASVSPADSESDDSAISAAGSEKQSEQSALQSAEESVEESDGQSVEQSADQSATDSAEQSASQKPGSGLVDGGDFSAHT